MSGILRVKSFFLKFVTRFNKERMGPIFRPRRRSSSACSSFLSFENSVSVHSSQQDSFCLVPIIMYRYFVFFWMSYRTLFFSPYCHTVCYEFECFKWQVVCSLVRTQGCRKQQQGYLFHTNVIIPHETSQQHTLGF